MKCEEFWSRMETGGAVHRLLARRHAARCPSCRQSLAKFEAIKGELAPSESPSAAHRRLWERAMAADVPCPTSPKYRVAIVAAFGMAALVALAVGAWMAGLWPSHEQARLAGGNQETAEQDESPVEQQIVEERPDDESLRRIHQMKSSLLALSAELEQLSRSASLLEEREQVGQLLSDYEQL